MPVLPKTLSDHPSLIGIVRFPFCTISTEKLLIPLVVKMISSTTGEPYWQNMRQEVDMATTINGAEQTSNAISIPKTNVTDFYPYTYYVLCDGEVEPLIMYPQYLPSTLYIKGKFALSNQPVERYYPSSYKGDTTGNVYNITNLNQMMLPTATNEGLQYMNANANAITQNRRSQVTSNVLGAISTVGSAFATGGLSLIGGGVQNTITGIQAIKESDARNKDSLLTPSTISSFGSPSTRRSFNTDSVKLIKYTIKDNVKQKINNYCDRYGNKFNNYATIDIKAYNGYVKFIDVDLDTNIDNIHTTKIKSILERGVYIE